MLRVKDEIEKPGLNLNIQKTNIRVLSSITSWQKIDKKSKQWWTLFSLAPKSLWKVTVGMKLKDACSWKESFDKPRQHIKQQRHPFHNKGLDSQSYGFSIVLYGCVSLTIKKAER